jgi:type IV pilus assembly protein PilW
MKRPGMRRLAQAGFTIVEMMVALGIGLVVVAGLGVAFVNMKTSFLTQDKLTQLQDAERVASTMLAASVQEAGYFPNPGTNAREDLLLADPSTTWGAMDPGQAIEGTAATSGAPESISLRFNSTGSDTLMNCVGGTLSTAGTIRNVFYVDSSTSTLGCVYSVNGGAYVTDGGKAFALIGNVKSMSVLYGIDSDGDGSVDEYLAAGSVASGQWTAVHSVRITLKFFDPVQSGKDITWVQTINLMNYK